MWKMLHPNNAIDNMAVVIRFREPVASLSAKRILRAIEPAATFAGLINRQPIQSFQVAIGDPSFPPPPPLASQGMMFQKTSLVRFEEAVVNQLSSQVTFQPAELTYSSWMYHSWNQERNNIAGLFKDALRIVVESVAIAAVRLEYLDRFIFEGDVADFDVGEVLDSTSDLIAPQIFTATDLFHSHTGRFEDITEAERTLSTINIDAQILTGAPPVGNRRTIATVTAAERQYLQGLEIAPDNAIDSVITTLDGLHGHVIDLFGKIINKNFAQTNGLPHV